MVRSPAHAFDGRYQDIVLNERIVYAYDMHLDEKRISVSLATVELKPEGSGTRLIFTEQGAFLDGYDDPAQREQGPASCWMRWARSCGGSLPGREIGR